MLRCLQVAPALLIALPAAAFGQQPAMSGLVRHRTTGQPIECLHVALADSLDRTVAHTVTDSAGMFILVAPDTGSFRVQFDLPGLEPLTGPLTRLAAGEMNEQEYPISFDRKIAGELEIMRLPTTRRRSSISANGTRLRGIVTWRSAHGWPRRARWPTSAEWRST